MPGLFAYLLNGTQLGNRFGQLGLCLGIINIGSAILDCLLCCLLRFQSASLVEIAATKNVTQAQLVDAIMAAKKEAVQSRVAAGTLTQERATIMLQQMEQATNQAVTRTTIGQPEGRGGAGAMGRMGQAAGTGVGGFGQGQGRAAR